MTIFVPDDDFESITISIKQIGESIPDHGAGCLMRMTWT